MQEEREPEAGKIEKEEGHEIKFPEIEIILPVQLLVKPENYQQQYQMN